MKIKIYGLLCLMLLAFGIDCAFGNGWYKYPVYYDQIDQLVITPAKAYYRSGKSLFSYNNEDDEHYAYTTVNKLNGALIKNIYPNYNESYLLVAYQDGNIDLVYDNGKVVNLPEIRESQHITIAKEINDVAFADDIIAIATNFGIVIYDVARHQVKESGIYNENIDCIAIINGNICIGKKKEYAKMWVGYSPINQRHSTIDAFQELGYFNMRRMYGFADNLLAYIAESNNQIHTLSPDFENNACNDRIATAYFLSHPYLYKCKEGWYGYKDGQLVMWNNGTFKNASMDEMPQLKNIEGKIPYNDALTCGQAGYMRWSADGERLYISNIESSDYKSYAKGEAKDSYQTTNIIEDDFPRDVSLMQASAYHSVAIRYQNKHNNKRMYGDPTWIIEDVDDPDTYYCGNSHEGLYVCRYNPQSGEYEEVKKFTCENAPFVAQYENCTRVQDVNIDPAGNLWVGAMGAPYYFILPADKRSGDIASVTYQDWRPCTKLKDYILDQKEFSTLFCKHSSMVIMFTAKWAMGIVAIDTKGTYDNPNDDETIQIKTFIDQDGLQFEAPAYTTFAIEDRRGCVWIGTSNGLFEITDPTAVFNPDFRVRRIKVPRNDGTSLADYLLDGEIINWMCVDASGRKWIGTDNSGLYLVSERGDEIIRHYTKDNSPLDSNTICTVECDPHSNKVYVGTPQGLFSFLSDSAPVAEDYSEILAYPNPVRPEYSGDVTITGLMENSIVKIADTAGRVVFQTRSEGGMAKWPVNNMSGKRVKSGIYYVFVSSGTEHSTGAATKIMVIN